MSELKLMTVVGTRPEIIRLCAVIKKCDGFFDHILVHTGQNYDYELNRIFFEDLELRAPDYYLDAAGGDPGSTVGAVIAKSYALMSDVRPDALLILGDTNSALCAIAAKRLKIPVFHMEAGNRCFDENLPEEINRRIVDHIADVNLAYSEYARRNLLAEGLKGQFTFVTGSPMAEVIGQYREKIESSDVLARLGLKEKKYILLSAHREENIDSEKSFFALMNSVNALAEKYDVPIIYSTHPRSAKMIEKRGFVFDSRVKSLKPFGFFDYNKLQQNALCVISDSGTLAEETSLLKLCSVSIRTSTERQEAVERGVLLLGSLSSESVLRAVDTAISSFGQGIPDVPDYTQTNVSDKIVKIITGYTPVINEFIWRKGR
ncbi:MAG: UDP-N-acetylglucosamine 2-epimerase (non-hydrolyzing) [Clostridia bacterium]|nr:UDP-N-acetylglucosamine 2-epimerase (non-hydrolyzing) [Clostridia bacterium]